MESIAKVIADYGILIVIAGVFLWTYIEDIKERKAERKEQSKQHDKLIELIANNSEVIRQNSSAIEKNNEFKEDIEDKLTLIENNVSALHSMIKEHNNHADEIYENLIKEIKQLKKASDTTK